MYVRLQVSGICFVPRGRRSECGSCGSFQASFREGFLSSVMKGMPTVAKVGRMMAVGEADAFLPRHITGYRAEL